MIVRLIQGIWILILGLQLAGARTNYILPITFILTALIFYFRQDILEKFINSLNSFLCKRFGKILLIFYITATFFAVIGYLILDYEALHGTYWDLAMLLQSIWTFANTGSPEIYFHGGTTTHYFKTHHSTISLFFLAALFKITQCPWVALIWQGFFLFSPALVALLWYKALAKKNRIPVLPIGLLFAFLAYTLNPVPLSQQTWPNILHIGGACLLALAYLFYYQKRFFLWFLCLVFLTIEKEEHGGVTTLFGLLVLVETLVGKNPLSQKYKILFLASCLSLFGVGYFMLYNQLLGIGVPFKDRFGEVASTPPELLSYIFTNPLKIIQAFFRPLSLKYLVFFLGASLVWLYPKWSVFKYLIPVLGNLILNSLANAGTMQMIKDHYAVIIGVGLSATLVFGVFGFKLSSQTSRLTTDQASNQVHTNAPLTSIYGFFAFVVFFQTIWGGSSVFRTFKECYALWGERKIERQVLKPIKQDKQIVVCCEARICSYLVDRPFVLEASHCVQGSRYLEKAKGKKAVYVVYSSGSEIKSLDNEQQKNIPLPAVPFPNDWHAQTPYLKLSNLITVQ